MSSTSSSSEQARRASAHTARETAEEKLFKDAAKAVSLVAASVLVLRAMAASITLYGSLLPVLYWYGIQTCPSRASFDAKAELRCVLRGDNLPADHPDKPRTSGLAGFVMGAMAALTSELATFPGYEVDMWSAWGAAWVVTVVLPASDLSCTWIGCNHKWYYWGSRKLSGESDEPLSAVPRAPESATVKIGNTNIKFDFGKQD